MTPRRHRWVRRSIGAVIVLLLGVLGLGATIGTAAAQTSSSGTVYVVHGIPNTPVDVYVNGKVTLSDFTPGTVAGPLTLPAGSYDIAIRPAGAPAGSAPVIQSDAPLQAGANVSLVAHLSASGAPTLTAFSNPVGSPADGQGRLVVRHVAAAPAVDVLADDKAAFTGVTNPQEKTADLPVGTVSAAVALAGTTTPVIGPADLTLKSGQVSIVYAVGSAQDKTLQFVTQSLDASSGQELPLGANAGSGGLAGDGPSAAMVAALTLGGLALIGAGGAVAVRSRRCAHRRDRLRARRRRRRRAESGLARGRLGTRRDVRAARRHPGSTGATSRGACPRPSGAVRSPPGPAPRPGRRSLRTAGRRAARRAACGAIRPRGRGLVVRGCPAGHRDRHGRARRARRRGRRRRRRTLHRAAVAARRHGRPEGPRRAVGELHRGRPPAVRQERPPDGRGVRAGRHASARDRHMRRALRRDHPQLPRQRGRLCGTSEMNQADGVV